MGADRNDRMTPQWFVDLCARRFGLFDLDAAATAQNTRVPWAWLGPDGVVEDALSVNWTPERIGMRIQGRALTVWCNPPYGPPGTIPKWIAHAQQQRDLYGTRTLMLLINDPSTAWCQQVKREEWFEDVPFRIAFEAPDGSTKGNVAMEPSCLVWIAPKLVNQARTTARRRPR